MLKYDEWVVPGEVEYAEKKAAEIEAQIQKYHKTSLRGDWERHDWDIYIQITEHIVGMFKVTMPEDTWNICIIDIHITNDMKLDWFQRNIAPIDEPKIFELPPDDIRSSLPEWDESLISDDAYRDIMCEHSAQYNAIHKIEEIVDSGVGHYMLGQLNVSETRFNRIAEGFLKKLKTANSGVEFTEMEKRIEECIRGRRYYHDCGYYYNYFFDDSGYEVSYFPLNMTEEDIINAIREAYCNASKRSKRIAPGVADAINIANHWPGYEYQIENYECLYQGRAGDLVIRFLFDFKNMKIVNAYPLMMNGNAKKHTQ